MLQRRVSLKILFCKVKLIWYSIQYFMKAYENITFNDLRERNLSENEYIVRTVYTAL